MKAFVVVELPKMFACEKRLVVVAFVVLEFVTARVEIVVVARVVFPETETFPANVDVAFDEVAVKNGADPPNPPPLPENPGAVRLPVMVTSPLIVSGPLKVLVAAVSGPSRSVAPVTVSVPSVEDEIDSLSAVRVVSALFPDTVSEDAVTTPLKLPELFEDSFVVFVVPSLGILVITSASPKMIAKHHLVR
jgi:hypothetical protein